MSYYLPRGGFYGRHTAEAGKRSFALLNLSGLSPAAANSPRGLPDWSRATTTWTSRCVSTPKTTSTTSSERCTLVVLTPVTPFRIAVIARPATRKTDDTVTGHVTGKLLLGRVPPRLDGSGTAPRSGRQVALKALLLRPR